MFKLLSGVLCVAMLAAGTSARSLGQESFHDYGTRMVGGTWHNAVPAEPKSQHTYTWGVGEKFLYFHGTGGDLPDTFAIIGVDPASGLTTWWNFRADGSVEKVSVTEKPLNNGSRRVELSENRGSFTTTYAGPDEITAESDAKLGGKQVPAKQVWKRSKQEADLDWLAADPPAEFPPAMRMLEYLEQPLWLQGELAPEEPFTGSSRGQWILDGNFFLFTSTMLTGSRKTQTDIFIAKYDPDTQQCKAWEFDSQGALGTFVVDQHGQSLNGDWTTATGERYSFAGDLAFVGDRLKYKAVRRPDGKAPEHYGWTYHPQTEAKVTDPHAVYLIGDWKVSGRDRGEAVQGTLTAKPAAGGESLLMEWQFSTAETTVQGVGLAAMDPEIEKPVERGYVSNGNQWTNTYETELGSQLGQTTGRRVSIIDGERYEFDLEVNRTSADSFIYTVKEQNGKIRAQLTFERMK